MMDEIRLINIIISYDDKMSVSIAEGIETGYIVNYKHLMKVIKQNQF